MGEWDEGSHPRDTAGKFTAGEAGEHASTSSARSATLKAISHLGATRGKKPTADAPAEAHHAHADRLNDSASRLGGAAQAHTDAGRAASERGDHAAAREHFAAARDLNKEARATLHEAREHSALARASDRDQARAEKHRDDGHAASAKVHEAGKVAEEGDARSHGKAQGDHSGRKGARGSAGSAAHGEHGAHGGGGKGHGEREEGGLAKWVSERLEELPEKVHEAGEGAREAEEGALGE